MLDLGLGLNLKADGSTKISYDAVVTSWVTAVQSNSGTVSANTTKLVNNLVKTLKTKTSLWTKITNGSSRFSLMCGDQLAAALVPLIVGGGASKDTGNNLVSGDYTEITGIKGNGSNKTVDTLTSTQAGQTTANGCVIGWYSGADSSISTAAIKWSDGGNKEEFYILTSIGNNVYNYASSQASASRTESNSSKGMIGVSTISNAMQIYRRGEPRLITKNTTSSALATAAYRMLGRPGGGFESRNTVAGYFIGPGLTEQEVFDLHQAVAAFYTALGRPVEDSKLPAVCYGDSTTSGSGSTGGNTGWPYLWYTADTTRMIFNGGVAAQTSSQIKSRLLANPAIARDVTLLLVGTNDYASNAAGCISDIDAMVSAIQATGNTKFAVLTPIGFASDISGSSAYNSLISICNHIATTYPNNYIDTRANLIANYNPGSPQDVIDHTNDVTPTSLRSDSVHPNDAGYAIMETQIKTFIDNKGW